MLPVPLDPLPPLLPLRQPLSPVQLLRDRASAPSVSMICRRWYVCRAGTTVVRLRRKQCADTIFKRQECPMSMCYAELDELREVEKATPTLCKVGKRGRTCAEDNHCTHTSHTPLYSC